MEPISIPDRLARLASAWQPDDVTTVNDAVIEVVRLHGAFPWHHHDEDELFLCWDGSFRIEMRGRADVTLRPGDVFVVPRDTEHRPVADEPADAALLERPDTLQYGN